MLKVFFRNADPVVADLNLQEPARFFFGIFVIQSRRDNDYPAVIYSLNAVKNEVHKYLFHLFPVNPDFGQVYAKLSHNLNIFFLRLRFQDPYDPINDSVYVLERNIRFRWPGKTQKICNESTDAIYFF